MRTNHVSLGKAIDDFILQSKLQDGLDEALIESLWNKLMGGPIARHTTRLDFREHKLYITVDAAPLKNELFYSRDKIKELLNRELGREAVKAVFIY